MRRSLSIAALAALVACEEPPPTDPAVLADIACRGMPGISVDAPGRAFLRDAIDPEELALWDEDPYLAVGMEEIGLNGYGVIRVALRCRLESLTRDEAVFVRTEPDLDGFEPFKRKEVFKRPTVERELRLEIIDTPTGPRVRSGAAEAREMVVAARAEAEAGRGDEAIARLQALQARFPDPMLRWELRAVEALAKQDRDRAQLSLLVEEDLLWAVNDGPEPLEPAPLPLDCGGQLLEEARPALEPGSRVALAVTEVDIDPTTCALARPLPW